MVTLTMWTSGVSQEFVWTIRHLRGSLEGPVTTTGNESNYKVSIVARVSFVLISCRNRCCCSLFREPVVSGECLEGRSTSDVRECLWHLQLSRA